VTVKGGPLAQFEIERLVPIHIGGYDISYTNAALLMTIAVALIALLLLGTTRRAALVPSRLQSMAELSYEFVAGMVNENVGHGGEEFFPLVFSIFMFILLGNLLGLIPFGYAFTSQVIVTTALALSVFLLATIVAFWKHGIRFLGFFFPPGAPVILAPILVPIELISYLSRPVSLSLRLFANMMAGHTVMAVFAGFTVVLGVFGFLPIAVTAAVFALEIVIAVLQAYVFAILTCLYLHDSVHMH
jgi:F-type H+-transporting ATPase subunit a